MEDKREIKKKSIKEAHASNLSHSATSLRHTFADFRADPTKMRTKAILYIILSLIGVAYTVTCFITGLEAYSKIGKNPLALTNLIHNWRSTPITDIKALDGDVCKNGYTPMLTRYWPGTKDG